MSVIFSQPLEQYWNVTDRRKNRHDDDTEQNSYVDCGSPMHLNIDLLILVRIEHIQLVW